MFNTFKYLTESKHIIRVVIPVNTLLD